MIGHQVQPPLLRDGRDDEDQLHPGERLADALAGTAAEWEIRELRQRRFELRRPPIGIESIGVGGATERADRKAKQAGSRFSEICVDASRLRSLIAGVSDMGAAYSQGATNASDRNILSLILDKPKVPVK